MFVTLYDASIMDMEEVLLSFRLSGSMPTRGDTTAPGTVLTNSPVHGCEKSLDASEL